MHMIDKKNRASWRFNFWKNTKTVKLLSCVYVIIVSKRPWSKLSAETITSVLRVMVDIVGKCCCPRFGEVWVSSHVFISLTRKVKKETANYK